MALPALLIVSFVSGWVASMLGLAEFGLHKYSSIAAFVAAGAHLALHWRSLVAQMKRLWQAAASKPATIAGNSSSIVDSRSARVHGPHTQQRPMSHHGRDPWRSGITRTARQAHVRSALPAPQE